MSSHEMTLVLDRFQGPFDLLLHLIKQADIDINDIPMTEITEQYLAYIDQMQELALDEIGDYLVMASTLLEIKSQLLLPIEPEPDLDSDYEPIDPRQSLVQQLLIYQEFQSVASHLEERERQRQQVFSKPPTDVSEFTEWIPLEPDEISLDVLQQTMERLLLQQIEREPIERQIRVDRVTVSEKMDDILSLCRTKREITLAETVQSHHKEELIASFLAMLELVRKQIIFFKQENRLGDIFISAVGGTDYV